MHRQTEDVKSMAARREALGLSQTDLASRTGISLRTIERIEAGSIRRPQPLTRRAIAGALGCHELDLWPTESEPAEAAA